jgi:hypothetical protein
MQSLNLDDIAGVVRVMRHILLWTAMAEGAGALILSVRFAFDFGVWNGICKGVFHAYPFLQRGLRPDGAAVSLYQLVRLFEGILWSMLPF